MRKYIRMKDTGVNLYCQHCKARVSAKASENLRNLSDYECSHCGNYMDMQMTIQGVHPQHQRFLRIDETRKATWWHSTRQPISGWMNQPEENLLHVGTYASSSHRARGQFSNTVEHREFLHFIKLRVKPGVRIDPVVRIDDVDCYYATKETGVVRYVNAYENPGSISLVGLVKDFELADVRCWNAKKKKYESCAHSWSRLDNLLPLR